MPLRNPDDVNVVFAVNRAGPGSATRASSTQRVEARQRGGHTTKTVRTSSVKSTSRRSTR